MLSEQGHKLERYRQRLAAGRASEIKPKHVDAVIAKLADKQSRLRMELAGEPRANDRERLQRKLAKATELIDQAQALKRELARSAGHRGS